MRVDMPHLDTLDHHELFLLSDPIQSKEISFVRPFVESHRTPFVSLISNPAFSCAFSEIP